MKNTFSILSTLALVGIIFFIATSGKSASESNGNNVSIVDGVQIIEITAKGGYSPSVTMAKAGMPSVLRVETNGTYDCSSALVIPGMDYRENLTASGTTEIQIPAKEAGETLEGVCGMGMYDFTIQFE